MQSTWNAGFEAFKDSVSETHLDDAISADDDTNESWTQPWDLPAGVNYAGHSDITATASRNIPTEHSNAKG